MLTQISPPQPFWLKLRGSVSAPSSLYTHIAVSRVIIMATPSFDVRAGMRAMVESLSFNDRVIFLNKAHGGGDGGAHVITYATMCSGTDEASFVLDQLANAILAEFGIRVTFRHRFAADVSPTARSYAMNNHHP